MHNQSFSSPGSLFANMDSKWPRSHARAVRYGRTLEIVSSRNPIFIPAT